MSASEVINRSAAVLPNVLCSFWRTACEVDDAQTAAWEPFLDDDDV